MTTSKLQTISGLETSLVQEINTEITKYPVMEQKNNLTQGKQKTPYIFLHKH